MILIDKDTHHLLVLDSCVSTHGTSRIIRLSVTGVSGNSYHSLKRSEHHHVTSNRLFKWELSASGRSDGFFGAFYVIKLVNVLLHPVNVGAPPGDPEVVNRCQAIYINLSSYI